jgi:hypothetical protein
MAEEKKKKKKKRRIGKENWSIENLFSTSHSYIIYNIIKLAKDLKFYLNYLMRKIDIDKSSIIRRRKKKKKYIYIYIRINLTCNILAH